VRLAAPLTAAVAVLLAAPASGMAVVTFGSNLSGGGSLTNFASCSGVGCTYVQTAPLTASHTALGGLTAPSDGVITRWRIKSGSAGGAVTLRILRRTGDATFTSVTHSGTQTTESGVADYLDSVTVKKGDYLGVDNASSALIFAQSPSDSIQYWTPPLADSSNRQVTGNGGGLELQVNANLEPDQDCDGLGDETQDPNKADGPCAQGPGSGDTLPPGLNALTISPKRWAVKAKGLAEVLISARKRKKPPKGATFSYTLSEAAKVVFTVESAQTGRRVGGQCVKPAKGNRKARHCTRFVVVGAFAQQGASGKNTKAFSGKIGKRSLKPGKQRATLVATDAAGNVGAPQRVGFTVVKP
jgi:hypothetical protein